MLADAWREAKKLAAVEDAAEAAAASFRSDLVVVPGDLDRRIRERLYETPESSWDEVDDLARGRRTG